MTKKIIPIYKCEAYLIPVKYLSGDDIEKAKEQFCYRFYAENKCSKCDNVSDRHNDICDACDAFKGMRRTAKVVQKGERDFLSLPVGASKSVKRWLIRTGHADNYEVKERHPERTPFKRRIKMIRKPYDYQLEASKVMIKKRRGILKSAPRTGKTVMATEVICQIGAKTLILGAQLEWLKQFRATFIGVKNEENGEWKKEPFTNARPLQIKICKTLKDFESTDICLATFSQFMSKKSKALLEQIRELFTVVCVDEVHYTPALQTSRILARFNAEFFFGLSGTVERKVTDEIQITHDLVGPIIHTTEVERMRAKLVPFFPGIKIADPKGGQAGMTYFQSRLESNTPRRQLIIKEIIKYAKMGHLVLVPLTRVASILKWTQEINAEMERPGFALPFFGTMRKDKRAEVIEMAREYRCRVLVGNIALLSTGLDIPRASCLFEVSMTSNIPKAEQRLSRILTPMDDKPDPLFVYVLDESDLMRKCRRNEFWNAVVARFDPQILPEDKRQILSYLAGREQTGFSKKDLHEGM